MGGRVVAQAMREMQPSVDGFTYQLFLPVGWRSDEAVAAAAEVVPSVAGPTFIAKYTPGSSVAAAITVNVAFFRNTRAAYLTSCSNCSTVRVSPGMSAILE